MKNKIRCVEPPKNWKREGGANFWSRSGSASSKLTLNVRIFGLDSGKGHLEIFTEWSERGWDSYPLSDYPEIKLFLESL